MAYCTIQDLIDRFGQKEIIQLSDRSNPKTNAVNTTLVQAKIDDGCAEMDLILSCCYDICELKNLQTSGYEFPVLKHWNADIARKHLYDCIRLDVNAGARDHKAESEYLDYQQEIEKMCECGRLMAYQGTDCIEVPKRYIACFAATDQPSKCLPRKSICCCPTDECYCGCGGSH